MSEQMPEITEADARYLEGLAELKESDPEGYEALISDALGDAASEDDPARAHAEQLLQMLSTRGDEQGRQFVDLLNAAYQQHSAQAEADKQ